MIGVQVRRRDEHCQGVFGAQTDRLKTKGRRSLEVHMVSFDFEEGKILFFLSQSESSFFLQGSAESRRVLNQRGQDARDASAS